MKTGLVPLLLVVGIQLGAARLAHADEWKKFSAASVLGDGPIAVTRDGALNRLVVTWIRQTPNRNTEEVILTTFLKRGSWDHELVAAGWFQLWGVDLQHTRDGLRAFFSGVRSTRVTDPFVNAMATALRRNGRWIVDKGPVATNDNVGFGQPDVTVDVLGRPVAAWNHGLGIGIHRGYDAEDVWDSVFVEPPAQDWQFWWPGVATGRRAGDGKIVTFVGWCMSNSRAGDYVRVDEWPEPANRAFLDHSSFDTQVTCYKFSRTALATGPAPRRSVYLAYPKGEACFLLCTGLVVLKDLSGDNSISFGRHQIDNEWDNPALSVDPRTGDVWVAWEEVSPDSDPLLGGPKVIRVARYTSNLKPTKSPKETALPLPPDTDSTDLVISPGRCGRLDLVARLNSPDGSYLAHNFINFPAGHCVEFGGFTTPAVRLMTRR